MAYTGLQLITRAYYLSQVVSRELQTVSGAEVTDGLYLLNALLDFKRTDLNLIPYYQEFNFTAIQGVQKYHIDNLLDVDSLTFNIGPVRYPMMDMSRKAYFATPRVDNIESLPMSYRIERSLGGADIYIYFLPADNYVMTIFGKFALTDVTLETDLSAVYDTYYIEFLRYSLAEYICSEYGTTFPDKSQQKLDQMTKKLQLVSPKDLTLNKQTYFTNPGWGVDWQSINLWKGYWPI